MADTTLGAIVARYDTTVTDTIAAGGLWVDMMPPEKTMPFVILCHDGDDWEKTFESEYTENSKVRFEVFAIGCAACELIATRIKAAFDLPNLTQAQAAFQLTNGLIFGCVRTGYRVQAAGELETTGKQVYQATISYTLGVRKALS